MTFTQASNLNDGLFGKVAAPIRLCIETRAQAWEAESLLPRIFRMETSESWGEHVTGMTESSGFKPVGESGAKPLNTMQEGYGKTFKHYTWKDRLEISREMVDDVKMMDLTGKPLAFINGYYTTREEFGAALLAGAAAGKTAIEFEGVKFDCSGADGLSVFHTAHPLKVKGGTQSNCFSNAFSLAALTKAQSAMKLFKGDNGKILKVAPKTIIIPQDAELQETVYQAVASHGIPGTPNHGDNVQIGMWNVITWPYLNQFLADGVKPWILFDEDYNAANAGNLWFDRVKLEVTQKILDNDALAHDGYARFSAGFADWRQMCIGGIEGGTEL